MAAATEPSKGHSTVLSSRLRQGRGEHGKTREFRGPLPHLVGCCSLSDGLCIQPCRRVWKPGPVCSPPRCMGHEEVPKRPALPVEALGDHPRPCLFHHLEPCSLYSLARGPFRHLQSQHLLPDSASLCCVTWPSSLPTHMSYHVPLLKTLRIAGRAYPAHPGMPPHLRILNFITSAQSFWPRKVTVTDSGD